MIHVNSIVVGKIQEVMNRVGRVQTITLVNHKRVFDILWEGDAAVRRHGKRALRLAVDNNDIPPNNPAVPAEQEDGEPDNGSDFSLEVDNASQDSDEVSHDTADQMLGHELDGMDEE